MNVLPLPALRFAALSGMQEERLVALITSAEAWSTLRSSLTLPLLVQAMPVENTQDFLEYLAQNLPTAAEVIYMVGSDPIALNAAKYVAHHTKKPLIVVPSALNDSEWLTPHISLNGERITTGAATEVILDLAVLSQQLPIAAIADVLSIITALMDWGYAHQHNRTTPETRFLPWAASVAANIASQALKIASSVGKGEPEALTNLVDLLCLTVQLDNLLGHQRASRGTEHLFAQAAAQQPEGAAFSYADRVACGILLTSALHKKDTAPLRAALESAGLHPTALPSSLARATLNALAAFAAAHKTPFGIAHELQPNSETIETALQRAGLT
ncbi:MAG: iron-containing alcohol dehydrogenase [Aggregatilineales bacterium]